MSLRHRHSKHYEEYLQRRGRLLELTRIELGVVEALRMDHKRVGDNPPGEVLRGAMRRLESDRHRALFAGRFSAGKSTLLNALFSEDLLPRSVEPTTGVLTRVNFADKANRVAVLHPKPGMGEAVVLDLDDIRAEIKRHTKVNHFGEDATGRYAELELALPFDICRNNVEIIDSVGLDDPKSRETVTFEEAPRADAIVYCMKATDAYSASDIHALEILHAFGFTCILFVITNYQIVREGAARGETPEHEFRQRMANNLRDWTELGEAGIVYVDSWEGLDGRLKDQPARVEASGILDVEAALESFLARDKGSNKLLTSLRGLKKINEDARSQLAFEIPASRRSLEALERACADARIPLEALETRRRLLVTAAEIGMRDISRRAGDAAEIFFRSVAGRIPAWAESYEISNSLLPPTKSKVAVVVEEVTDYLKRRIQQAIGEWSQGTLQPLVDGGLTELRATLEPDARSFLEKVEELKVEISTGSLKPPEDAVGKHELSAWDVLIGVGVSLGTGDFIAGGMSMVLGMKAMLRSLTLQIAGVVLLTVLSLLNPLTLVLSLISGGILGGFWNLFQMKTKIKEDVAKTVSDAFLSKVSDSRKEVEKSVDAMLKTVRDALDAGLASRVSGVKRGMEEELARKRSDRDGGKKRSDELSALQVTIDSLGTRIETLLAECGAALPRDAVEARTKEPA